MPENVTAPALDPTAAWFIRNFAESTEWVTASDQRCWAVLGTLGRPHNLLARSLPGYGVRRVGDGLKALIRSDLATFDGDEMTSLVIAAHEHACRVAVLPTTIYGARIQDEDRDFEDHWERLFEMHDPDVPVYWDGAGTEVEPVLDTICEATFGPERHRRVCGDNLTRETLGGGWFHDDTDLDMHNPDRNPDDFEGDERHIPEPRLLMTEEITGYLWVQITPRVVGSHDGFDRHPTLEDLRDRVNAAILRRNTPTT